MKFGSRYLEEGSSEWDVHLFKWALPGKLLLKFKMEVVLFYGTLQNM